MVALYRRCHDPILREATLDRDSRSILWIGRRSPVFTARPSGPRAVPCGRWRDSPTNGRRN
jgi:hypothetical protein